MDRTGTQTAPDTLTTTESLDSLPIGSIIRGSGGGVWEVVDPRPDGVRYRGTTTEDYFESKSLLRFTPITCIWTPADQPAADQPAAERTSGTGTLPTALRAPALRHMSAETVSIERNTLLRAADALERLQAAEAERQRQHVAVEPATQGADVSRPLDTDPWLINGRDPRADAQTNRRAFPGPGVTFAPRPRFSQNIQDYGHHDLDLSAMEAGTIIHGWATGENEPYREWTLQPDGALVDQLGVRIESDEAALYVLAAVFSPKLQASNAAAGLPNSRLATARTT